MSEQVIIIDGNNFSTLDEFWDEVTRLFDLGEYFGRNMDALEDFLIGEHIVWVNATKSKKELGYEATARFWEEAYKKCPADALYESNRNFIKSNIDSAQKQKGQTLFDMLGDCIRRWNTLTVYDDYPESVMQLVEQGER